MQARHGWNNPVKYVDPSGHDPDGFDAGGTGACGADQCLDLSNACNGQHPCWDLYNLAAQARLQWKLQRIKASDPNGELSQQDALLKQAVDYEVRIYQNRRGLETGRLTDDQVTAALMAGAESSPFVATAVVQAAHILLPIGAPQYDRSAYGDWQPRVQYDIIKRDMGKCVYCDSSDDLTVDHVKSLKQHWDEGGSQLTDAQRNAFMNDKSNLVTACRTCNSQKGSMDPFDWLLGLFVGRYGNR